MIKLSLAFLAVGLALSQNQIKLEQFSYSAPTEFIYRRHYTESLSQASKLSDYGTPSGSKITVSEDYFQV